MTIKAVPMIHIRPYTVADRDACITIFRSNLPRYFDNSELPEFEVFLDNLSSDYFVVEMGGTVVACGGCYAHDGVGYLSWGMVSNNNHRASIGTFLLSCRVNHLFSQLETSEIMIDTSQHAAGFFARYGFHTTQQITDGFGQSMDQVSMSLLRDDWRMLPNNSFKPTPLCGTVNSKKLLLPVKKAIVRYTAAG